MVIEVNSGTVEKQAAEGSLQLSNTVRQFRNFTEESAVYFINLSQKTKRIRLIVIFLQIAEEKSVIIGRIFILVLLARKNYNQIQLKNSKRGMTYKWVFGKTKVDSVNKSIRETQFKSKLIDYKKQLDHFSHHLRTMKNRIFLVLLTIQLPSSIRNS